LSESADIAIVGAGPAGSSCAAELAERGYAVTLVDQCAFPRDKPCGDGLTPQAIAVLRRLGLDTFLSKTQPIEGCRVVLDHRQERLVARYPARAPARCVPRAFLDRALLDAALERGARFVQARAREAVEGEGEGECLLALRDDAGERRLTARRVVACDGATSAIRRNAGLAVHERGARALAVRGYYATERPLEGMFSIYVPLEVGGTTLLGYGWVFPIGERLANIGVFYFQPRGVSFIPNLRVAMESFIHELRLRSRRRFGEIERLGRLAGGSVSVNFDAGRCARGGLVLAGDAASTADPFTGEGIGPALEGGAWAAHYIHASLERGSPLARYGSQLARRMPRVGQDFSTIARSVGRADAGSELAPSQVKRLGFISSVFALVADEDPRPESGSTAVASLLREVDAAAGTAIESFHDHLLDAIRTRFPLTTPTIARELRARGGPIYAAALIVSVRAFAAKPGERARLGARATEYLAAGVPILLSGLSDRASADVGKLNNALALLAADFSVSQAMLAIAGLGPEAALAHARVAREVCEGGMMESIDRHDLDRSRERYLAVIERRVASVFGFATALGAELAGAARPEVERLRRFGLQLGVAHQLAEELIELGGGPGEHADRLASTLRAGAYGLPTLLAARSDRGLRKTLTAGLSAKELPAVLARIRATDAGRQTRELARERVALAREILDGVELPRAADLLALADWVQRRAAVQPTAAHTPAAAAVG
jgi:geranylgeranyl reductase family protein